MFTIKRETDYAIQFLRYLAGKKDKFKSLREFSELSGISFWFLQKIARRLHLTGLIDAEQGVNGGYRLNIPKTKLTMLAVYEAMEGKLAVSPCVIDKEFVCAGKNKKCFFKNMSAKLNGEIKKSLEKIKII